MAKFSFIFAFIFLFLFIFGTQLGILAADGETKTPEKLEGAGLEVQYPEIPGAPKLTEKPLLPQYVLYLYYFAIAVSGFIALGAGLYGAIKYLTSAGNPAVKLAAREYIFGGLLGIAILLLSYIILTTINPQLKFLKLELPPSLGVFVPEVGQRVGDPCRMADGTRGEMRKDETDIDKDEDRNEIICMPKVEEFQQVPVGTLAEEVLGQNKIDGLLAFIKGVEERSEKVKEEASGVDGLKDALDQCQCGRLTPSSCSLIGNSCSSGGACTGDPCLNRDELAKKAADLLVAKDDLNNFISPNISEIEQYGADVANLLTAAALLKESIRPVSYDNFLEFRNILESFAEVKSEPFPGLKGPVPASGYDSMNFYLDKVANQSVLEKFGKGEFSFNPVLPPGIIGPHPPKNRGALICPVSGRVTAHFGCNPGDYSFKTCPALPCPSGTLYSHCGIDIDSFASKPVYAAADGEVLGTGTTTTDGKGVWVLIWHPNLNNLNLSTLYLHLESNSVLVNKGDKVHQGEQIARKDATGFITAEHLHFEVYNGKARVIGGNPVGEPLNPLDYAPCPEK